MDSQIVEGTMYHLITDSRRKILQTLDGTNLAVKQGGALSYDVIVDTEQALPKDFAIIARFLGVSVRELDEMLEEGHYHNKSLNKKEYQ